MAFNQEVNTTKIGIEDFEIKLFVPGPSNVSDVQRGTISFQIALSNGGIETKIANLLDRLNDDATGQTHLANLASLRDYISTRLAAEALPSP